MIDTAKLFVRVPDGLRDLIQTGTVFFTVYGVAHFYFITLKRSVDIYRSPVLGITKRTFLSGPASLAI